MKLIKNEAFDFIGVDDENMVVFDPDSGNSHFMDETGIAILNLIDGENDTEEIIAALSAQFNAEPGEIARDVGEFIDNLIKIKMVLPV